MPLLVNSNSVLQCTFGTAPCPITATSAPTVSCGKQPAATVMDHIPMTNIKPFLLCTSPSNPAVSAALGVSQPCTPLVPGPWAPGAAKTKIGPFAALDSASKCNCTYGGVISVITPAQTATTVK